MAKVLQEVGIALMVVEKAILLVDKRLHTQRAYHLGLDEYIFVVLLLCHICWVLPDIDAELFGVDKLHRLWVAYRRTKMEIQCQAAIFGWAGA